PPRVATSHMVIIPIIHSEEAKPRVMQYCSELAESIRKIQYNGSPLRVLIDTRDLRGGEKSWGWIKKGIPLRLEVGLREIEAGQLNICRRDKPHKETSPFSPTHIVSLLEDIQVNLLAKATVFRDRHTVKIDTKQEF